ncbi:DUF4139 domain-containing protein [Betaproteobacteria bacterium SCN1]|jgi:hypothetical protein|nr:DUF4139 domain-containing protein [Betaproteobacteria bacterium SCN1]MBN8759511.1 DUF4139 domain-containing protein [Thiobacillus sp.]ODU89762.1 MAG: DUF4139 domain-containing protein [Thiobacillus sp. SCN 65-179]OJW37690.1 MAG: DUF4139 domain-containing protein [Thiobacillus sp. 65-69]
MHSTPVLSTLIAGAFAATSLHAAPRDEIVSAAADQKSVAVTIYNDNLALVKDARQVRLDRDLNRLAWREVSAQMRPETAQLRNAARPDGFRLLEQNFDFDLLTPAKLLDKYVGREITVVRTNPATGAETRETATVLSTNNGVVLKFADRIETGAPGRIAFPGVPDTLRDKPTLVISLLNPAAGMQHLELSYLTGGLSWRADYVAELNADDSALDLNGWVTLTNQSGAAYPNAKLQLVAGDLNRVREAQPSPRAMMAMAAKVADAAEMQQESLFEYHLYTMQRPTTLAENQTKQVALMSATRVPVKKEFLLEGANYYYSGQYGELGQKMKVGVFVDFANKGEGLGIPLPKGVIRVYKQDSQGNAQFVGEDRIDHTPKNETVRLKLGDAFDVTADKKQTAFQKLAGSGRYNYVFESAYEIVLKNAKPEPVTVTVREPMPGDWTMVSESLPHTQAASGTAEWKVKVPAEGQATLTYRVRVRY